MRKTGKYKMSKQRGDDVNFWDKPRLYANHSKNDKEAEWLLIEAKIPYEDMGPSWDIPTPYLEYGPWRYFGIDAIKRFIESWKKGELPPLEL